MTCHRYVRLSVGRLSSNPGAYEIGREKKVYGLTVFKMLSDDRNSGKFNMIVNYPTMDVKLGSMGKPLVFKLQLSMMQVINYTKSNGQPCYKKRLAINDV